MRRSFSFILLFGLTTSCVPANELSRGDWFKSLKQPDTGMSCCDISDCRQTEAKWVGDQWAARVRGVPRLIPNSKVLKSPHSIDGEAYVCASESGPPESALIYCFIPPTMGF